MPRTIQAALSEFRASHVDLRPGEVERARSSRDFLRQRLPQVANAAQSVMRFTGESIPYGSFARKTKIAPLDDVDLMFTVDLGSVSISKNWLKQGGATAMASPTGHNFGGTFHRAPDRRIMRPDGSINSTTVLNAIKLHLSAIPQYSSAEIRRNGVAVVLNLNSYPWSFDIVPALELRNALTSSTRTFVIPDGLGGWQYTDPRLDAARTTQQNQQAGGHLLGTIRLLKFWNRLNGNRIQSYHLEAMLAQASSLYWPTDPLEVLQNRLSHLASAILWQCPDPKGIGGNLDGYLDTPVRQTVGRLALEAANHVSGARQAAAHGNHRLASQQMRQVFGPSFPECSMAGLL